MSNKEGEACAAAVPRPNGNGGAGGHVQLGPFRRFRENTALSLPAALAVFSRKDVVSLRLQGSARYPGRRQSPTRDSKPSHPTWTIWTSPLENVKVKSPPTEGAHVAE